MSYNKRVKKKNLILGFVLWLSLAFLVPQPAQAAECGAPYVEGLDVIILAYPETTSHTVAIDLSTNFSDEYDYKLTVKGSWGGQKAKSPLFYINENKEKCNNDGCVSINNRVVTWEITEKNALEGGSGDEKEYFIDLVPGFGTDGPNRCDVGSYTVKDIENPGDGCLLSVYQNRNGKACYQNLSRNACFSVSEPISVSVTDLKDVLGNPWEGRVGLKIAQDGGGGEWDGVGKNAVNGSAILSFNANSSSPPTTYRIYLEERKWFLNETFPGCEMEVTVQSGCNADQCMEDDVIIDPLGGDEQGDVDSFDLCGQIPEKDANNNLNPQRTDCETCFTQKGIWTAIGCIDTSSTEGIIGKLMTVGMSIAGGIALLMILASAFLFATSEGEPKRTGEAKEILTSAIIGLIFIIFSVTILQFIGVNILKIPGFGE